MVGVNGYRVLRAWVITPHAQRERGKVMGVGAIYMFVDQKKTLNCTLAIDSPFQTFSVGLLLFID